MMQQTSQQLLLQEGQHTNYGNSNQHGPLHNTSRNSQDHHCNFDPCKDCAVVKEVSMLVTALGDSDCMPQEVLPALCDDLMINESPVDP
jgi:hypothetical protein